LPPVQHCCTCSGRGPAFRRRSHLGPNWQNRFCSRLSDGEKFQRSCHSVHPPALTGFSRLCHRSTKSACPQGHPLTALLLFSWSSLSFPSSLLPYDSYIMTDYQGGLGPGMSRVLLGGICSVTISRLCKMGREIELMTEPVPRTFNLKLAQISSMVLIFGTRRTSTTWWKRVMATTARSSPEIKNKVSRL